LANRNFLETVIRIVPMYMMRALGGAIYLVGALVMVYNLIKTAKAGSFLAEEAAEAPALEREYKSHGHEGAHRWIERKPVQMLVLSLVVVAIGGAVEIIPSILVKSNVPEIASVQPYTPLELEGRDIYLREGCYNCHSQMIRPFRDEVARYGEYSKAGEFVYDHPFQWGSKRTGPDLHRVGGKYSDSWHYIHMLNPKNIEQKSIMPLYPWLFDDDVNTEYTVKRITLMRKLGVPYPEGYEDQVMADYEKQRDEIVARLAKDEIEANPNKEIIALIAYLQRLGTDIKAQPTAQNP
jgi:cytochrome c oxidase cbb3-type subunit I/II